MATTPRIVGVGQGLRFGNALPMVLIAGPCQLEGEAMAVEIAGQLKEACAQQGIGLVFKASFDKANRSSGNGQRGPGLDEGLRQLEAVKSATGLPILTDVHAPSQCAPVAEIADILQIPAFLCRQTDLLAAAARTARVVNVKKGQFLAPWDMGNVVDKLDGAGGDAAAGILLTERGTTFGYNRLIADMTALPEMAGIGWPVIMDATHAVQSPGGLGTASGGNRAMAPVLARAALAVGVAGLFLETHPDPDKAPSDGPNMIALKDMPRLIEDFAALDRISKSRPYTP
jgi:2-dehydro-3-deoxyphosphooctonate aldolase (KDO 8-P synthase)